VFVVRSPLFGLGSDSLFVVLFVFAKDIGSLCRRFSCSLFVWFYLDPVFSVDIPECACCSFDVFDLVLGSLLFCWFENCCFSNLKYIFVIQFTLINKN